MEFGIPQGELFLTAKAMILSTIILGCAHLCLTLSWMHPL